MNNEFLFSLYCGRQLLQVGEGDFTNENLFTPVKNTNHIIK